VEQLIASGHPPAAVWNYTPRQIAGFLFFSSKRKNREDASKLSIGAMAARGDPKDVKKQVEKLGKD
jgi:hypothetical protein